MTEKSIAFPQLPNDDRYFRPMSLDQDFMHYGMDDLLYGFLVYHTTYDTEKEQYYITERRWNGIRPIFCRGLGMPPRHAADT